jgi:hypothetical protein
VRIAIKKHAEQQPIHHVRIIERRIEWLEERIKLAKRAHRNAHFDISERDALRWALDTCKSWVDIPNVEDDLKDF